MPSVYIENTSFRCVYSFRNFLKYSFNNNFSFRTNKNKIVAKDLPMPHSPRIFNNELYVLLSATGELAKINTIDGSYEIIIKIHPRATNREVSRIKKKCKLLLSNCTY